MIRDIKKLNRGGYYIGDFRYDEGIRINDSGVCPCLVSQNTNRGLSTSLYVFEVIYEDKEWNEKRMD